MQAKPESTVASKAKYLYYYVIFNIVSSIVSISFNFSKFKDDFTAQQNTAATQLSAGQLHAITLGSLGFGVLLAIILDIYLVRSKNVRAVRVWLIILFVFAVLGLLFQFTKFSAVTFVLGVISAVLLGLTLRQVQAISE